MKKKEFLKSGKFSCPMFFKFAKTCPEKEYKPYKQYKDSFKEKEVRNIASGKIEKIVGYKLMHKYTLILQSETGACHEVTCSELYVAYRWLDGSVFGEENV